MPRFLNHFNRLIWFHKKPTLDGIYSPRDFHAAIERERARSDRTGDRFSLVLFNISDIPADGAVAPVLVRALTRHTRSIDQVGWLDTRHIGVVMPSTSPDGAMKLADDIVQRIVLEIDPPTFKVLTYPSRWTTELKDLSADDPSANDVFGGGAWSVTQGDKAGGSNRQAMVEGLEPFLVRPIPA